VSLGAAVGRAGVADNRVVHGKPVRRRNEAHSHGASDTPFSPAKFQRSGRQAATILAIDGGADPGSDPIE
jgi:hypothetical protein